MKISSGQYTQKKISIQKNHKRTVTNLNVPLLGKEQRLENKILESSSRTF